MLAATFTSNKNENTFLVAMTDICNVNFFARIEISVQIFTPKYA